MAQAISCWPLTVEVWRRSGFAPMSVPVGFVVDKLALGQVFSQVLQFSPSVSSHHGSPYSCISSDGMNSRPVCGHSSET
jgi:hypothetical protein